MFLFLSVKNGTIGDVGVLFLDAKSRFMILFAEKWSENVYLSPYFASFRRYCLVENTNSLQNHKHIHKAKST